MKRRDFLRLLSIAPLAPSVLMAKEKLEEKDDEPEAPPGFYDFYPDTIMAYTKYEDKLYILCEHSAWEIKQDAYGELQKQLIFKC